MQINEFEFSTLIRLLKSKAKRIIAISFGAGVLGFLIALCIPKEYESSASIIPEVEDESSSLGSMASLASMAGVNLGSGTDAIGPDLYPNVVSSNRFIVNLLYTRVKTIDGKVDTDFLTYSRDYCSEPWWGTIHKAFGKMMKKINPPKSFNSHNPNDRINPEQMSMDDEAIVEAMKSTVVCQMDEKTGMINIAFRAQDPLVAKTMVDTIMTNLQSFITDYRTSKARTDLQHYIQLKNETHAKYEKAQKAYARYCDSHMGTLLQAYQTEQEALENEMSVALSAYTQAEQQVQLGEAKVQEKTPAFTVVETACIPARHASPKKMLMALALMFVAGMGSIAWYYIRLLFGKIKA